MNSTATETHTCTCKVCNGKAITAPAGYISGTAKQVRELTHNYVVNAHAPAGIGRMMADRAGIKAV